MDEDELSKAVLIPLLRSMGFRDVTNWHGGILEQGKDIVAWKPGELGQRMNYALLVKAVPITGAASIRSGATGDVFTQLHQLIGNPFRDRLSGDSQLVNQCWIVTNKEISKEAQESIGNAIGPTGWSRNIVYVDGECLWSLVRKYLPLQSVLALAFEAQQALDDLDTHYRPTIAWTDTGPLMTVSEKFPGAAKEKPLHFKMQFEFPDTAEGQAAIEALEHHHTTGAPVSVPAKFIKAFEVPELLQSVIGDNFRPNQIEISSAHRPNTSRVDLRIESDTGDNFIYTNIALRAVQIGDEELTLSNHDQEGPFHLKVVVNFTKQSAQAFMSFEAEDENVAEALDRMQYAACMTKACTIQVIDARTKICWFETHRAATETPPPDARLLALLEDLVKVQQKLKRPIPWPDREFTRDELETIALLRSVLHDGRVKGKWEEVVCTLSPEGRETILGDPNQPFQTKFVRTEGIEVAELFGATLPLGKVRVNYGQARILDEEATKAAIRDSPAGAEDIQVRFVPVKSDKAEKVYLDWQPTTKTVTRQTQTTSRSRRSSKRRQK